MVMSESQSCKRDKTGNTVVELTGIPFVNEATTSRAEFTVQLFAYTSSTVTWQED